MIKKIILIATFMSVTLLADMNWSANLGLAYDMAERDDKLVMVMLTQTGCPGSATMESGALIEQKVVDSLNKDFMVVQLNVDDDDISSILVYSETPTFYFLNSEKEILDVFKGIKNEQEFLEQLEKVKALK